MHVIIVTAPRPPSSSPRKASGIFEIGVEGGAWLATDDTELFQSFPGPRLVSGQPYTGPVREPAEV